MGTLLATAAEREADRRIGRRYVLRQSIPAHRRVGSGVPSFPKKIDLGGSEWIEPRAHRDGNLGVICRQRQRVGQAIGGRGRIDASEGDVPLPQIVYAEENALARVLGLLLKQTQCPVNLPNPLARRRADRRRATTGTDMPDDRQLDFRGMNATSA